jgi:hypothetical protein
MRPEKMSTGIRAPLRGAGFWWGAEDGNLNLHLRNRYYSTEDLFLFKKKI